MKHFLIILFTIFSYHSVYSKTCVLSLFKYESREDKIVKSVFNPHSIASSSSNISIYYQAGFEEIESCFKNPEVKEILFLAHGRPQKQQLSAYSTVLMPLVHDQYINLTSRYFEKLSDLLIQNPSIQKLRVAVCSIDFNLSEKSVESNHLLQNLKSSLDLLIITAHQLQIKVDISPKFNLGSYLLNENVTRLSSRWLKKSLN